MKKEREYKEIELRSEEVQEVMTEIPHWILRQGINLLFVIIVLLLVGSYFFRYPDSITTTMTLTGLNPAAQVVARTTGKIQKLYISNNECVESAAYLAVIENPAVTEDVMQLKQLLPLIINCPDSALPLFTFTQELKMGSVQTGYLSFLRCLHDYKTFRSLNYYPQKQASIQRQIAKYRQYEDDLKQQYAVMKEEYAIAGEQYRRDSLLHIRKLISDSEHQTARSRLLQNRHSLVGSRASLDQARIQISQLEETLLDLELEQTEKVSLLLHNLRANTEQLMNEINNWELTYVLKSPIKGVVTFTNYWSENQNISSGASVFTIVPQEKGRLIGRASLPPQRSGKVKEGQRVVIRFANYPDQEFGVVYGIVSSISLVPAEKNYTVEIHLPNGLKTNYNKTLPFTQEMQAQADIVTEELRLIERLLMPLKKIWKERFDSAAEGDLKE